MATQSVAAAERANIAQRPVQLRQLKRQNTDDLELAPRCARADAALMRERLFDRLGASALG